MTALLVVLGLAFVVGVAVAAVPASAVSGGVVGGSNRVDVLRLGRRLLGPMVVSVVVIALSGWVVPGLVVGAGAFWALGRRRHSASTPRSEIERLDALASWIENVRDVMMAGEQPVGAITASVAACDPLIRPSVRRLAAGLGRHDPDLVLRRFADDLDDPLADLVAAGLAIAIRRGARTVPVLTALAAQAREQVDRRRLVEAERAPTRREVRALTLVMGTLVLGLLLFGRSEYLDAYDAPSGQAFLSVALTGYAALIVRVQRLATFPRPGRFLSTSAAHVAPDGSLEGPR